jgi:hypothetical protein
MKQKQKKKRFQSYSRAGHEVALVPLSWKMSLEHNVPWLERQFCAVAEPEMKTKKKTHKTKLKYACSSISTTVCSVKTKQKNSKIK